MSGVMMATKKPGVVEVERMIAEGDRVAAWNEMKNGATEITVLKIASRLSDTEKAAGAGDMRKPVRCLTQWEIDARESGWEYQSNSTNALMARVLAEGFRITN